MWKKRHLFNNLCFHILLTLSDDATVNVLFKYVLNFDKVEDLSRSAVHA